MVTTFDLDEYVQGALRGGAVGFILKDAGPTLLVEAVRAAFAGEALISPSITLRLLQQFTGTVPRTSPTSNQPEAVQLSEREVEVVRSLARGCTNREIAGELFISLSTVKGHLAGIQGKLGLRNRVEVALWASENRL